MQGLPIPTADDVKGAVGDVLGEQTAFLSGELCTRDIVPRPLHLMVFWMSGLFALLLLPALFVGCLPTAALAVVVACDRLSCSPPLLQR